MSALAVIIVSAFAGSVLGAAASSATAQSKPLTIRLGVHTQLMGVPDIIAIR
jgi:NitT/TauT family transport system substrate-binding protein